MGTITWGGLGAARKGWVALDRFGNTNVTGYLSKTQ